MSRTPGPRRSPAGPGRFVFVSAGIHGVAFIVLSAFARSISPPPASAVVSSVLQADPPALLPDPEPLPPAPPEPECPEFGELAVDGPELEASWEPIAIAVSTSTGSMLARTPRAKPRARPVPVAAPAPVVEAPPAPLIAPPAPVAARLEPATPRETTPPRAISMVKPAYPEEARACGVEGAVRLEVTIGADGSIADVRVVESSGSEILDAAAAACVRRWKFAPATEDGLGVVSVVRLPQIRFRLDR